MRRIVRVPTLVLLLACAAAGTPLRAQEHPDLRGSWALSVSDSEFGMTSAPDSLLMDIERADERLVMKRRLFISSMGGETVFDFDMPIDGRSHRAMSEEPVDVIPEWDGSALKLIATAESNMGPLEVVDLFRREDDDTLVIERSVELPGGAPATATMVYHRRD